MATDIIMMALNCSFNRT